MNPALVLPLAAAATLAQAQDVARGRLLYETHCGTCHYERVHERPPERRKVNSLSDLRDMVARWSVQTKHRFTLDEREDVTAYLNRSHYRLAK